jgi:glycogen(starch) synthase
MRILHLTTEFPPVIYGGLGTAVGGLVTASARAGIAVRVLLVGETGLGGYGQPISAEQVRADQEEGVADPAGVSIVSVSWYDAQEVGIRLVEQWRPDVVHLHAFWLWPVARAIQERMGTPLVYTVHSLDRAEYELGQGPPECLTQWEMQAAAITTADRVIALSRSEKELLMQYCPGVRDRVRIVGNGIADPCRAQVARRENGRSEHVQVLYIGRFVERKGIGDLLSAIPSVLARAPATRFILIGGHRHCSGEEMERRWLPPALSPYRSQISFMGWLAPDEAEEWYDSADVLVVPSWYEPFGMVILEGMLHGLPIVASAIGGPAEILEHERTGLLFPPRDVEALACALLRFVENPAQRRNIGTAAVEEVHREWLWSRIVEKMRCVYQEMMSPKHPLAMSGLRTS